MNYISHSSDPRERKTTTITPTQSAVTSATFITAVASLKGDTGAAEVVV